MSNDDEDDLTGLDEETKKRLRKGLLHSLAKAGANGNASAAKRALELIDGGARRPDMRGKVQERDQVLAWLAEDPTRTSGDAVAHFWPSMQGTVRSDRMQLIRVWQQRFDADRPRIADGRRATVNPRPEADFDWASLPRIPFLRRQLAEILADLTQARSSGATASAISTLDARAERIAKQLATAMAEAGEGDQVLDQQPTEVARRADKREQLLDVFRRARARQAALGPGERDL